MSDESPLDDLLTMARTCARVLARKIKREPPAQRPATRAVLMSKLIAASDGWGVSEPAREMMLEIYQRVLFK